MEGAIVALLGSTLPRLYSVIGDKCKHVEPDVRSIQDELQYIKVTIQGSCWRGTEASDLRRTWIAQLTRLADEIQDCIDSFQVKMTSVAQFSEEIAELNERICDSSMRLQRHIQSSLLEASSEEVPPTPTMNDAEEDLLTFVQNQSEKKAKVICAIGFAGQTSDVARRVYDNVEVRRQFIQRAWVSAKGRSVDDVLTEILRQLRNESRPGMGMLILGWVLCIFSFFRGLLLKTQNPVSCPSGTGSDINRQLKSRLSRKRYLIVIQDVETEDVYNGISAFSWANRVGGRIIVMTDIQPAVRPCICGNDVPLIVPDSSTSGLVLVGEMGTEMSYEETCFALCAAAVAKTQGLLGSGYERGVLEECLLYFSMFPRDHDVRRNPLIRRWLAEGLVIHANQRVPEYVYCFDQDIMAKHLDILIRHNIIKSVMKSNNGKVKRFHPPAMVLNHICGNAAIENFITLLCGPSRNESAHEGYIRRLSLHPHEAARNGGLDVPNAPCLHTLVVFPTVDAEYGDILRFDKHRLLRVLDLKECADVTKDHVSIICDMLLLLKYLSLGSGIKLVTRKIRQLQRLETLDISTTAVVTVSSEVLKLPKLKHLLGKFRLSSVDCPDGRPSVLKKGAKKLLRLKDKFSELQAFLWENSVLETLAGIVVGDGVGLPQLMSHMGRLRKVKIWCDSTTDESTYLTGLREGIKVFISHGIRTPGVDYSLSIDSKGPSQPFLDCLEDPGRLTSLKLRGDLTLFRPVAAGLVSLQELCLAWTNLSGARIQIGLSNLRCQLKFLKLVEENLVGLAIQGEGPFLRLERICLVGTQSLEEIYIQGLTRLISLHLLCITLGALPGIQIGSLRNLKEVGLHSGVDAGAKRSWEDAATGHQLRPNVVSIQTP